MAYVKNIWVDQDVERPKTYEVTNNQDGSITLTDSFGLVTELGTPVNETNMNHIEDGIDGCAIRKHNLTETFNLGEWVLGGTGDDEGLYKSLIANNVGNAITDDTKWEMVTTDLSGKMDTDGTNAVSSVKFADGQWVKSTLMICENVAWTTNTPEATYSLSNYLPNDSYNYEVLLDASCVTGTTSGRWIAVELQSDTLSTDSMNVCYAITRTSSNIGARGNAIIPVGTGRYIKQYSTTSSTANGTYTIRALAYRRIGTNQ
jgi:hypothetical protein